MNAMPKKKTNAPAPPSPPKKEEVADWLGYQTEGLRLKRDTDVLPAIAEMVKAHPVIADNDEDLAGRFAENILLAKDLIREAGKAHKEHKEPYLTAGRVVDGWKNGFEAVIERALAPIEAIARDYAERKHAREHAAREAEAERARVAARKARDDAAAAERENMWGNDALALAEEAERKAAAARRSEHRAAHTTATTQGDYGAKSMLVRKWKWQLSDITQVPPEHLLVNAATIMIAAKPRDPITNKPTAIIPGIEWVEDVSFTVRG
jgi:hypothetical protein